MTEQPTRILIVDDSALYRQAIQNVLRDIPRVEIVGIAKNGVEALGKIAELTPDLLTLDVQMPGMNGIELLREVKRRRLDVKAIMVSSLTSEGTKATTDALLEGAFDFILKPSGIDSVDNRQRLCDALGEKIAIFRQTVATGTRPPAVLGRRAHMPASREVAEDAPTPESQCQAVLIGSSTGGPAALRLVLPKLPADFPVPVLVVQHMPAQYTQTLAARLDELCALHVQEAVAGDELCKGRVLIAPGGQHTMLAAKQNRVSVRLTDDPPENGCRPSVDYLFRSAAGVFDGRVLGVILTGMGRDGVDGCNEIKNRGGCVFAQHEVDCVVYGMPKATIEEGLADRVLPLGKIAPAMVRHLKRGRGT